VNTVHDRVDLPTTPIDENTRPNRVELTPLSFLERAALAFGARTALVHGEHRYTYRDRCVDVAVSLVWLPPEKHRLSQTALPRIVPPASRIRVTMVASMSGTYPSSTLVPFIMGTPATHTLSFMATVLPDRGPDGAPLISVRQYQAPKGLSSGCGSIQGCAGI
jgi:hypothetical protein